MTRFFKNESDSVKHAIRKELSENYNGYSAVGTVHVSPTGTMKLLFNGSHNTRHDNTV